MSGPRISDMTIKATLPVSGAYAPVVLGGDTTNYRFDLGPAITSIGVIDLGALPAGTTIRRNSQMSFTAHSGGTTDARNAVEHLSLSGVYAPTTTYNYDFQNDLTHTAGTVNIARGVSNWIRLGFGGTTGGGNLNYGFVFAGHVSNEYSGTFDRASIYYAEPVDLADGTGPINYLQAFYCRDQVHATRTIAEAVAFDAEDFTVSARVSKPTLAHFRSSMTAGEKRYSFLGSGGASMLHYGAIRIGDLTEPSDKLEVKGYAKLSSDGTIATALGYHELTNDAAAAFVAVLKQKHASTPNGLQISFSAAAPNNGTQIFLLLSDSVQTRLTIFSNGTINTVGGVLSTGTAGIGYATGAGGTVTQATSRTTGVTLNKVCGSITLVSAAGTATWQSFTVTNSTVAATDSIRVVQKSGTDKNMIHVTAVGAGSFEITFATTGGTTTEQPVFNFAVVKAVAA